MNAKIKELEKRMVELVKRSEESTDLEELEKIQKQLSILNEALEALRAAQAKNVEKDDDEDEDDDDDEEDRSVKHKRAMEQKAKREWEAREAAHANNPPKYIPGKGFIPAEENRHRHFDATLEQREKAGNDLKDRRVVKSPLSIFGELRAVTIGGTSSALSSIVVPTFSATTINPDFPVVSSLVDSVAHLSLDGGESFNQPFITGIDAGDYTGEGENAATAETQFDYAEIHKTKITAYAEITEELERLPNAAYADTVFQNIRTSIRKTLAKEILVGSGNNNQIVGIFSNKATAIDSNTDLELSAIDDKTLDEIVYHYGGDEEVEDPAVLILNKFDLMAFAKVRTSTKQKFYDIQLNGNGGTISGVPFIINSACKALMAVSGTSAGNYCMAYGSLSNYQLVEFSQMLVKKSEDYKFLQGMTAFRGAAWFGGNVVRRNGFLRVKKAAS